MVLISFIGVTKAEAFHPSFEYVKSISKHLFKEAEPYVEKALEGSENKF